MQVRFLSSRLNYYNMIILQILILVYCLSVLGSLTWVEKIKGIEETYDVFTPQFIRNSLSLIPILNTSLCIIYFLQLYESYWNEKHLIKLVKGIIKRDKKLLKTASEEEKVKLLETISELEDMLQRLTKPT